MNEKRKIKKEKQYNSTDDLRALFKEHFSGKAFKLDCGHHVTFGHPFGNSITYYNEVGGVQIVCSQCGY